MTKTLEEIEEELLSLIAIQQDSGNYDYDPYMHGMLNGMIVALSVINGVEPEFAKAPETWLSEFKLLDKFNKSGAVVNKG